MQQKNTVPPVFFPGSVTSRMVENQRQAVAAEMQNDLDVATSRVNLVKDNLVPVEQGEWLLVHYPAHEPGNRRKDEKLPFQVVEVVSGDPKKRKKGAILSASALIEVRSVCATHLVINFLLNVQIFCFQAKNCPWQIPLRICAMLSTPCGSWRV